MVGKKILSLVSLLLFFFISYSDGFSWTAGQSCGTGYVYDCSGECVDSDTAYDYIGDGFCDDGTYGYVLTCSAFSFDGGDCGSESITITSPSEGSTLSGNSQTFQWGSGASEYWFYAGSSVNSYDYFNSSSLGSQTTSITVTGLPTDGSTVYVRFWYYQNGWNYIDYTYRAATNTSAPSLSITELWPLGNAKAGQSSTLWAKVRNSGSTSVSSGTKAWFYVDGPDWSGSHWVGSCEISGLQSGYSQWFSTSWAIPASASAGAYRYWVKIYDGNLQGVSEWSSPENITVTSGSNPPGIATLISPSGSTTTTPTYTWNAVSNATWYYLWANDSTGNAIAQWYSSDAAGCASGTGTCSVTPSTNLNTGNGTWWINTWNSQGYGGWSYGSTFNVQSSSGGQGSGMEQDIDEVMDIVSSVGDLSPMLEEVTTLLGAVMNGDSSIVTISPSLDNLDMSNLPSRITINVNFGNGYRPEGSQSTFTGSMEIIISGLSLSEANNGVLVGEISLEAYNIKRDGELILDGYMMIGMDIRGIMGLLGGGGSASAAVDITFSDLQSLDYQINGSANITIPSLDMENGQIAQPVILDFHQLAMQGHEISGSIQLTQSGDTFDILCDLDTNAGNINGTVRVNSSNTEEIIISTPYGTLQANQYTLDINNVKIAPETCTQSATGGNIVVTDSVETKTITFYSNCTYTTN